jgi:hypothetical protein
MRHAYDKNEALIKDGYAVLGDSFNPSSRHHPVQSGTESSGNWTTMEAACQPSHPITCLTRIRLVILGMDSKI